MRLGAKLSLAAAAALLLASSGSAFADTTYTIATTTSFFGTISGSVTGTGNTLTGFDVTAVNGPNTYVFDSSVAGDTGSLSPDSGYTLPGGIPLNSLHMVNSAMDSLELLVVGDFTSGLTPTQFGEVLDYKGSACCTSSGAETVDFSGAFLADDNVSLTLQPNVAPTPEPSSWLLLATGLAGLCSLALIRHNRLSLTRTRQLPPSLSA